MKKGMKVRYLFGMRGWAGPAPCSSPPCSVDGAAGGGGGWRAGSCLGILRGEGGFSGKQAVSWNGGSFWRVKSAGFSRTQIWQVFMADFTGGIFWRVILAHLFGGFSWPVSKAGFEEKKSKEKRSKMYTQ